jgi:SRP54-type protein, GTPase domain
MGARRRFQNRYLRIAPSTKLDGHARGEATLSTKEVMRDTVKLVGVGETLQTLDDFVPERIVGQGASSRMCNEPRKMQTSRPIDQSLRKSDWRRYFVKYLFGTRCDS